MKIKILSKKVKMFLGLIVLVMLININANAITFNYDIKNKVIEIESDNGLNIKYKYDQDNRIKEISYGDFKIKYKYDQYGRLSEIRYDDGSRIIYEYDKYGRLIGTRIIPGHVTLVGISVEKQVYDMDINKTTNIKVIGKYSNGSSRDITNYSTFIVANNNIVTIQNVGIITAKAYGETDLKISYLDKTCTVKINVINRGTPRKPNAPTGLIAEKVTQNTVNLKWNPAADSLGVAGYDIYSGSNLVGSTNGTSFSINGLENNKEYTFKVRIKDVNGNLSDFSEEISVKTLNVVTLLDISVEKEVYDMDINETMNIKVTGKYSDGSSKDITNDAIFTTTNENIITVPNQGTIVTKTYGETDLKISYLDKTYIVKINVTDTTEPSEPEALVAEDITQTTVNLKWAPSTDNAGLAGYDIYLGNNLVGSTDNISFLVNGLEPDKEYTFKVLAKDVNGNLSDFSEEISVKTLSVVTLLDISVEKEVYDMDINETMNIKVTGKYSDGSSKDITNDAIFTTTNENIIAVPNQGTIVTKNYGETALNIGYLDKTYTVKIRVVDKIIPSSPNNLVAESITEKTVNLRWSPPIDNVDVVGYDIYLGSDIIGSADSTSFIVKGLESNKEYIFKVRARDVNGNLSELSEEIKVKTLIDFTLADLSKRYNMSKNQPEWEEKYDLNNDGIIDIYDIAILCRTLG
ncbi:fibronectin type III domain-containing protein [Clostridium cellulovorans]|uniref:Fibronectin type III domain protein n=1 Tax=Clostridium cellulovorans (strain ATCC 35296 / DSM 3052 / OCM 3 / 743B) TaxID=573061 RepID=D9SQ73_CLOC7|nr:fibronectin type III domain-containing protein [Clostridium cellulovorans]ADL50140.1 Fibronectin type III domain protein [Clostridium cellulovorans 743B]